MYSSDYDLQATDWLSTPLAVETRKDPVSPQNSGKRAIPFPRRLYKMLREQIAKDSSAVRWSNDGLAFYVTDENAFVAEVLPQYAFKASKMQSFQRNLNIYGFQRVSKGRYRGAYMHPHFSRDMTIGDLEKILRDQSKPTIPALTQFKHGSSQSETEEESRAQNDEDRGGCMNSPNNSGAFVRSGARKTSSDETTSSHRPNTRPGEANEYDRLELLGAEERRPLLSASHDSMIFPTQVEATCVKLPGFSTLKVHCSLRAPMHENEGIDYASVKRARGVDFETPQLSVNDKKSARFALFANLNEHHDGHWTPVPASSSAVGGQRRPAPEAGHPSWNSSQVRHL